KTSRCLTTQKEKTYENGSCFNLQFRARVSRAWRAKREKEGTTKEKAGAINAARNRAGWRTTKGKRVTEGGHARRTPGGCDTAVLGESENGWGTFGGRWSTEDEEDNRRAAGENRWGTFGDCGGCWSKEDERITTDRCRADS